MRQLWHMHRDLTVGGIGEEKYLIVLVLSNVVMRGINFKVVFGVATRIAMRRGFQSGRTQADRGNLTFVGIAAVHNHNPIVVRTFPSDHTVRKLKGISDEVIVKRTIVAGHGYLRKAMDNQVGRVFYTKVKLHNTIATQ